MSWLERLRLRPSQREKKRVEDEREDDDRQTVILNRRVDVMEGVKDRNGESRGDRPDPRIVTKVDQVYDRDLASEIFRQLHTQVVQQEVILRTGEKLRHRSVARDRNIGRYQMPRLGRLRAADHPTIYVLVDRLDRDVILRRVVLRGLDRCRRDGRHRKVCIGHSRPIDRSVIS